MLYSFFKKDISSDFKNTQRLAGLDALISFALAFLLNVAGDICKKLAASSNESVSSVAYI